MGKILINQWTIGYSVIIVFTAICCINSREKNFDTTAYLEGIETWHANRVANDLKGPHGWLNLAGLHWLNEGYNTFGSDSSNSIVFPKGKIPEQAGTFILQQGKVTALINDDVDILIDSTALKSLVVYEKGARPAVMRYGSLEWGIIERNGLWGIRLRDLESEAVKNFAGVERFPVDPSWRIEGSFEKYDESRTIEVTNVLGQTYSQPCPGALVFEIEGKEFRIDAIDEGGEDYFIIFGDNTNEHETYPSGRYMYVSPPNEDGKVIIDFNKCYNPPCAFTEFATCPLPPKQNVLDVSILAGEKNYGDH